MKRTAFFPLALLLALTVSCQDDPVNNLTDDPIATGDTTRLVPPRYLSLAALTQWFEDEYSISFIFQIAEDDYMNVSEGVPLPYTPATDTTRIKRLLYYIGDNVLNVFPARTLAKYMPPTIYLVDSLKETYELRDTQTNPGVTDRRDLPFPIVGQTTGSYLVIGNAGPRFDEKKADLREDLLTLFIDRLLYNTTLPTMDAFQKFSEEATLASGMTWETESNGSIRKSPINYPYWDGLAHASSSTMRSAGHSWAVANFGITDLSLNQTIWIGRGVRKVGYSGCIGREYVSLVGMIIDSYSFLKPTVRQDFGRTAAFIITTPPAEREAYYAQVEADQRWNRGEPSADQLSGEKPMPAHLFQIPPDTLWYDARFPYSGPLGATAMRQKDAYVKTYFKTNFDVDLE
jgi:hypothetical protein